MQAMRSYVEAFSPDYEAARRRFRSAAEEAGAELEAHPIEATGPDGEELTIDVAIFGAPRPERVLVVSSGLHGPEGFFGSAVQLAWLVEQLRERAQPEGVRIVLLHALNPFGFAWRRRWNEDNVDPNRNFLLTGEEFRGSPPRYRDLDPLLNPPSPPTRYEPFVLKAMLSELRLGRGTLKQTLPVGQYEFPKGLFFGGAGPTRTQRILDDHLSGWLAEAPAALWLDLHTGLGRTATYVLLVQDLPEAARVTWLRRHFGADAVVPVSPDRDPQPGESHYRTRGSLETWFLARSAGRRYGFATVEFGTYPMTRVVTALRAENRAFFWTPRHDAGYEWTRQGVVEAFAPASLRWRETVVRRGRSIFDQALGACDAQTEWDFRTG